MVDCEWRKGGVQVCDSVQRDLLPSVGGFDANGLQATPVQMPARLDLQDYLVLAQRAKNCCYLALSERVIEDLVHAVWRNPILRSFVAINRDEHGRRRWVQITGDVLQLG